MIYLANAVYLLALVLTLPFWLYKSLTTGKYRVGMWDRLTGAAPPVDPRRPVLWVHAVSVGEVLLLRPLFDRAYADFPSLQIVLSVTTNTGMEIARTKYPDILSFYSPLDFSWSVRRVFRTLRPSLLVLTERELWPNLLRIATDNQVPVAVVNARLSERSFRSYRRVFPLLRPMLHAVRWWGAQSDDFAKRIRKLAHPDATVAVTGSMKFEGAMAQRTNPRTNELRRLLGYNSDEIVLVAGSTSSPEEAVVLDAFASLHSRYPQLRLLLVPRHPERFDEVATLIEARGFPIVRRSQLKGPLPTAAAVTLLDTMGELSAAWGFADIGYVGGSLECNRGGQSMIEPAGYGVATCFGPETWNCEETVARLLDANAAIQFSHRDELLPILEHWLKDPAAARAMGRRAQQFITAQQGAGDKTWLALRSLLPKEASKSKAIPA